MILSDIKQYLMQHKQATLGDLAIHFEVEPETMQGMLDQWVRKGKVVSYEVQAGCCGKTCAKCGGESNMEIYEWTA